MKPKVNYLASLNNHIVVGKRAIIIPINHPDMDNVSNNGPVLTSNVLNYNLLTGEFETENTIYVPE